MLVPGPLRLLVSEGGLGWGNGPTAVNPPPPPPPPPHAHAPRRGHDGGRSASPPSAPTAPAPHGLHCSQFSVPDPVLCVPFPKVPFLIPGARGKGPSSLLHCTRSPVGPAGVQPLGQPRACCMADRLLGPYLHRVRGVHAGHRVDGTRWRWPQGSIGRGGGRGGGV